MKNVTFIASLRRQQGLTQEALAEKCGLSVRTIQRLESGQDGNLETLNLVAQALDVKIGDLFESISDQNKAQAISAYAESQAEQVTKRKSVQKLYTMAKLVLILLMLGIVPVVGSFGLLWALMWPIGFITLKSLNTLIIEPKLDQRYPLTKGVNLKTYTAK